MYTPYNPTAEQIKRWKEIDELELCCATGKSGNKSQDALVNQFFEANYIDAQLEKIKVHREKTLQKLKSLEEYEELLLKEKAKRQQK